MRQYVAKALVTVALCNAAIPAFAHVDNLGAGMEGSSLSSLDVSDRSTGPQNYWMASSEYYVHDHGFKPVSASAPRRVLITGWHPVAGFEAEIAAEAANRAAHGSSL